ncbi:MAG TPA: GNAT family N-acetyltransferase [Thermoleophilaceae bacterium]|nr:GNAT family N-acetyltransferase [Thermoleophilaceae bacterium]
MAPEPFDAPDSRALRGELGADLSERYAADAEPGFKPSAWDVAVLLVARDDDGEPVGCGALRGLGDGAAEIKRMYVRPHARGTGVARRLLAALEEQARSRSFRVIRLETGTRQPEGMALYASAGYTEIDGFGDYAGHPASRCFERRLDR